MSNIAILIPAAGASSRMGSRDKLLELIDGKPLLAIVAERALETGADVIVALPSCDHPRANTLSGLKVTLVPAPDAQKGMGHSLRAAASALKTDHAAAMILPADMPDITLSDLSRMLAAWRETPANTILRGTAADGTPGHPVVIPARHFGSLKLLSGDQGARTILKDNPVMVRLVPLPSTHALVDLDTPEDWADWRATRH